MIIREKTCNQAQTTEKVDVTRLNSSTPETREKGKLDDNVKKLSFFFLRETKRSFYSSPEISRGASQKIPPPSEDEENEGGKYDCLKVRKKAAKT